MKKKELLKKLSNLHTNIVNFNTMGDPVDNRGWIVCTSCGETSIDDNCPVWLCNLCGASIHPIWKEENVK